MSRNVSGFALDAEAMNQLRAALDPEAVLKKTGLNVEQFISSELAGISSKQELISSLEGVLPSGSIGGVSIPEFADRIEIASIQRQQASAQAAEQRALVEKSANQRGEAAAAARAAKAPQGLAKL
jgi:hypothetical protein